MRTLTLVHSSTRKAIKRRNRPKYRDFDIVWNEVETRMLKRVLGPKVVQCSTEGLISHIDSVEQQRRINATKLLMGLTEMPKVLMERVNAPSCIEQEELEEYERLMKLVERRIENGESIVGLYEELRDQGMLKKRDDTDLTIHGFHQWVRKIRKKVLIESGGSQSRLPETVIEQIRELVKVRKSALEIYNTLANNGSLKRSNGGPDYGFICVKDRVGRIKRELRMGSIKGAQVLKLHQKGMSKEQIMETLGINNTRYYQHAVKLGIIEPKRRKA